MGVGRMGSIELNLNKDLSPIRLASESHNETDGNEERNEIVLNESEKKLLIQNSSLFEPV